MFRLRLRLGAVGLGCGIIFTLLSLFCRALIGSGSFFGLFRRLGNFFFCRRGCSGGINCRFGRLGYRFGCVFFGLGLSRNLEHVS